MKRAVKIFTLITLLSLVIVPAAMAQDGAPPVPPGSISGIIAGDGQYTTMAKALEHSGLMGQFGSGNWTLFAPNDQAFAINGTTAENFAEQYEPEQARYLVLHHALPSMLSTGELKAMLGDVTMANGAKAGLKFFEDHIYVNDYVKAQNPNILTTNGYIHGVDRVIQGPWPRDTSAYDALVAEAEAESEEGLAMLEAELAAMGVPPNSIAGIAYINGRYDAFGNAIMAAGLADMLSSGSWTVFMPTDGAVRQNLGIRPARIADSMSQDELRDFVLYHVLPGHYSTSTLRTILGDVTMANGRPAGLKLFRGQIWVNDEAKTNRANSNLAADNGIIHGVNHVILPPWPRVDTPPEPAAVIDKFNKDLP
jgi:uncharacterized surface protein with fasciclin (FAS1) repeats